MFGPDVYITDSNHKFGGGLSPGGQPMDQGSVHVENRCWVGAKAVILIGVWLGDGCVAGSGAAMTRSVDPGAVVAGVPARPIHSRCSFLKVS
jgi:acetyltransferase-like isoleucine patch superfamily enzyme